MKQDLVRYAQSLGFERVGITTAEPVFRDREALLAWLSEGRSGEMDYLSRDPEKRATPSQLLANVHSVISLAMAYTVGDEPLRQEGRISAYAQGPDYHKIMTKRLESVVRYLESMAPGAECRTFVDTGPLLERAFARRAGLGFVGKNTMLITKGLGSWVFLGSILTTADFPPDVPDERSCGECRLCIDACPTQAITAPFSLDPRRCISYLTIESEKPIPEDLRPGMGGWIFGCDVCQEVCPHNVRGKPPTQDPPMPTLATILSLQSEEDFRQRFAGTPVLRSGREGLVRNACVAAANLGRRDLIGLLQSLSESDSSPIVREHARWAAQRLLP